MSKFDSKNMGIKYQTIDPYSHLVSGYLSNIFKTDKSLSKIEKLSKDQLMRQQKAKKRAVTLNNGFTLYPSNKKQQDFIDSREKKPSIETSQQHTHLDAEKINDALHRIYSKGTIRKSAIYNSSR